MVRHLQFVSKELQIATDGPYDQPNSTSAKRIPCQRSCVAPSRPSDTVTIPLWVQALCSCIQDMHDESPQLFETIKCISTVFEHPDSFRQAEEWHHLDVKVTSAQQGLHLHRQKTVAILCREASPITVKNNWICDLFPPSNITNIPSARSFGSS